MYLYPESVVNCTDTTDTDKYCINMMCSITAMTPLPFDLGKCRRKSQNLVFSCCENHNFLEIICNFLAIF